MPDRCHADYLTSAERLFLDGLWKELGIDPVDERVERIEKRIVRAVLTTQLAVSRELQEAQPS